MKSDNSTDELKRGSGDIAHSIVKVVLSMIPWVGGPFAELFASIIAPPLERRRDEVIKSIVEGLQEIEERVEGFQLDKLSENETFVTTVLHAVRSAIATHVEEKRAALRNAVLNAALPDAPDDVRQKMFMELLDELTVWHLKILELFDGGWVPNIELGSSTLLSDIALDELCDVVEDEYPEMKGHESVYVPIIRELHSKNLVANRFPARGMMTRTSRKPELTPLGEEFLAFIRSPLKAAKTHKADES